MKKLSIVVPTYNEKDNINLLVKRIDDALEGIDHEIIFVDDSDDDTPKVIERIAKINHHVRFKHRTGKKGLSTAVLTGFAMADGDYLACMDADLQHPPEILYSMYVAMETGGDYCLPSRFIIGGSDGHWNLYRKLVSFTARMYGKLMLRPLRPISDPTGGLFMVRREVMEDAHMKPIGWKILVEALSTTHYTRIIEIPYTFSKRYRGETKINMTVTLQYLKHCLSLRKRCVSNEHVTVKRWSREKMSRMMRRYRGEVNR